MGTANAGFHSVKSRLLSPGARQFVIPSHDASFTVLLIHADPGPRVFAGCHPSHTSCEVGAAEAGRRDDIGPGNVYWSRSATTGAESVR